MGPHWGMNILGRGEVGRIWRDRVATLGTDACRASGGGSHAGGGFLEAWIHHRRGGSLPHAERVRRRVRRRIRRTDFQVVAGGHAVASTHGERASACKGPRRRGRYLGT